jgi:hypothetical protein
MVMLRERERERERDLPEIECRCDSLLLKTFPPHISARMDRRFIYSAWF